MKTLADLSKGNKAKIHAIADGESTLRLMEMGLVPGKEFQVITKSPFGDPIAIRLEDYSLSLRLHDAQLVLIELLD